MNSDRTNAPPIPEPGRPGRAWSGLVPVIGIGIAAIVIVVAALGAGLLGVAVRNGGMMGGAGVAAPGAGTMMGRATGVTGFAAADATGPGDTGFVPGTVSAPRLIRVTAGSGYSFSPSTITVKAGETITFVVTTMGPTTHEFMVGPADAVADDVEGTPEIADIGMMQTRSITYTFDGPGPFAFACHATGHYEAGMRGTITVIP
jgi:uncharacterized cupredoxin-like copper-binding protein